MGPIQLIVALICNLNGVLDSFWTPREDLAHFLLTLKVELAACHAFAVLIINASAGTNAGSNILDACILFSEIVVIVGSNYLNTKVMTHLYNALSKGSIGIAAPAWIRQAVVLNL